MIPNEIMDALSDEWVIFKKNENMLSNGIRMLYFENNTVKPYINNVGILADGVLDDDHDKALTVCLNILNALYKDVPAALVVPEKISPEIFDNYDMQKHSINWLLAIQNTPEKYIKSRLGRGNKKLDYVDVHYMQRALNAAFIFKWSFDILETREEDNEIIVLGQLTVEFPSGPVKKSQFGSAMIQFKKDEHGNPSDQRLPLGDTMKAAASDSLKKCASLLGIAQDVYSGEV